MYVRMSCKVCTYQYFEDFHMHTYHDVHLVVLHSSAVHAYDRVVYECAIVRKIIF